MKETRVTLVDDPSVGAVFLEPTTAEEQSLLIAGSPFTSKVIGGADVDVPDLGELHLGVVFDGQPQLAVMDRQKGQAYGILDSNGRPSARLIAKIREE
jgi:hypothetical protein